VLLTSTNGPDPGTQNRERKPEGARWCSPAKTSQGLRIPFLGKICLAVPEVSPRNLDCAF
jgi:hypothetical protein